jgi:hypothetical protein
MKRFPFAPGAIDGVYRGQQFRRSRWMRRLALTALVLSALWWIFCLVQVFEFLRHLGAGA